MLARILGQRKPSFESQSVGETAGELFASGLNCAQAVFQALTGIDDPRMMEMAKGFGGGVGGNKCLCGAISGAVMALGFEGKSASSGKLIAAFKEAHRASCCVALSKPYVWKSPEHLANCRRLTEQTAEEAARLLAR